MRPRVLDRLGGEFDAVIARERRSGGRWPRRATVLGLMVAAGGGTVAAAQLVGGDDVAAPDPRNVPVEQRPVPGSGRLAGLAVPDPDGGPPWDLRISDGVGGQVCSSVGQVRAGRFGIVGADDRFRVLPLLGASACAGRRPGEPSLVGTRAVAGGGGAGDKTIVSGIAGPDATRVEVEGRAGAVVARLRGADGAFLAVVPGLPEFNTSRVRITYRGRRTPFVIALGGHTPGQIADPDGGRPWKLEAEADVRPGARPGQTCVALFQTLSTTNEMQPHSVPRCGDLRRDPGFVDIRRYVPVDRFVSGELGVFGRAPSRTILTGAVAPGSRRVRALVPGRDPLALRPRRRTGAVAAIWTGDVDPERVMLEWVTASGRTVRLRGPGNLRTLAGRPFTPRRSPADRPVPPSRDRRPFAGAPRKIELLARARDPAGGPDHAVRAFEVLERPPRSGSGLPVAPRRRPRWLRCHQLGRVDARGRFGRLGPGGRLVALPFEDALLCAPMGLSAWLGDVVDDPASAAPRITQTAVWGAGAVTPSVRIELDGRRVQAPTDRGAFVHPLAPGQAVTTLSVDGIHVWGDAPYRAAGSAAQPNRSCGSQSAAPRAPDPAGGAPWALAVAERAGKWCATVGRLVGGVLGVILGEHGTFQRIRPFGLRVRRPGRRAAVNVRVQPFPPEIDPAAARRDRLVRTLPGRTAVYGQAARGVEWVTIRTGRELRALRPDPASGHFLVVVDGALDPRAISVEARFAGGRTVTLRGRHREEGRSRP